MVKLMIYAGAAAADASGTRTGGVPLTPPEFEWPRCRECEGPMQFLAQICLADADPGSAGLLSVFMCQNEPGLCEEWHAAAGGNSAFVFGSDATRAAPVPDDGVTLLDETSAIGFVQIEGDDYLGARGRWARETGRSGPEVLGQLGGRPAWLQNDETPDCGVCDQPMSFVVQLEEGHDYRTSANFGGGGCGYGFRCRSCGDAAFLWQR
ncbi:DUF1963 domain-containing protein [Micromonospora kangleipakensis]|uniref:DUF1963 domain-containing protein n=1 Tax=Micromonospora kangleipakensis TaxID=1077942 RepID=UPI001F5EB616|nr:DUF1963 domain-containing protein [Micromonospora kangleipakensis]